jgi:hypothetical protein
MSSTIALQTETLNPTAADALSRLERAFAPVRDLRWYSRMAPEVRRAVVRYENASARTAELSAAMDFRDLSPAEFGALEFAQDTMRESRATLTEAGQLHLVERA